MKINPNQQTNEHKGIKIIPEPIKSVTVRNFKIKEKHQ
jgi:hypothetical protein